MLAVDDFKLIDMVWNYVLLIIPFFVCKLIIMVWKKNKFADWYYKILAVLLLILWFIFIPNTAYVIMDIRHLAGVLPADGLNIKLSQAWTIGFIFIYALVGWLAFVYLLNQMRRFVSEIFGPIRAQYFVVGLIPFLSLGIMLGLLSRLNSWDVIIRPCLILNTLFAYISSWVYFKNFILFTIFLYLLYYLGNYFLVKKNL